MATDARGILVVDDDPSILHLFTRVLCKEGYSVSSTTSSVEALGMVEREKFDLVICDINMPDVNGLELVRALRRSDEDTSAIIVTAAPHMNSAIEALELGAVRYLMKPVSFDRIREVAREGCKASLEKRKRHEAANEVDRAAKAHDDLLARFTLAMEKLSIVYQPIVRWSQRSIFACELLLRSDGVFANPHLLIEASQRVGRERELSAALRRKSADVQDAFPSDALMFVNIAPFELLDDALYSPFNPMTPLANRVVLEITERGSLAEIPDVIERVAALKAMGYRIAIDDLGAGYSGLLNFAKLAPDVVKIDMSLVRDVDRMPVSARLVRSIVEASRDLGADVICEGVETAAERDTLSALGCDLFQGYLFARPGPLPLKVAL